MNFQRSTVSNTNLLSLYIVFVFVTGSYLAELLEDVFVVEVFCFVFTFSRRCVNRHGSCDIVYNKNYGMLAHFTVEFLNFR